MRCRFETDFFFVADCPPDTRDTSRSTVSGSLRSCNCIGLQVALQLQYVGVGIVSVEVTRLKEGGGNSYAIFQSVSSLQTVTVYAGPFGTFKRNAGVKVVDEASGDTLCIGSIYSCRWNQVGEFARGCEGYISVVSFTSGDGAICDSKTVASVMGGGVADMGNALTYYSNREPGTVHNPFHMLAALNPFERYLLIGLLFAILVSKVAACYLCIARGMMRSRKVNQYMTEMHHISSASTASTMHFNMDGSQQTNIRRQVHYGDGNHDETEADTDYGDEDF